uniref:CG-1 domain-containing protein n=1 Tax=Coturnix japonica TaxID=93934 RepID=A0A8C2Y8P3_COTJA
MNAADGTEALDDHGNSNGSHVKIFLPKKLLECLPKCSSLPKERHRWNTNEEIAAYLITFEKHEEWLTTSPKTRPQNGSMILYNRKKVKYRKDGYCWKKRKDGKTTREDHMKLKVQGVEVGELCQYSPSFFTWKLCMYVVDSHQTGNFHSNCHRFTYHYLDVPNCCYEPAALPQTSGSSSSALCASSQLHTHVAEGAALSAGQ